MWFASVILDITFFFVCLALGIGFMIIGVRTTIVFMDSINRWIDKKLGGNARRRFDKYDWFDRW